MARKKKEIKKELPELVVEENTKTMGNVKVTIVRGNKKLRSITKHNSATQSLCKYIRDALLGDYVIARRPGIIIPCEKNTSYEYGLKEMFSAGIPDEGTTRSYEEDTSSASGVLKFIIPDTSLTTGHKIGGFKLYSKGTSRELYAILVLDSEIEITNNTSIEVEWTMKVSPSDN